MEVPIACSLTEAARGQLGEWRDLLTTSAVAAERVSPTELSFRLRDDLGRLGPIVRLAQREKACCPFFDFSIRLDADRVALHVSVPAAATAVLDEFARASFPGLRG